MLIFVIMLSIIVALFALQNAVTVSLNFVFWSFTSSLVLVILGSFLVGVLVATCFLLAMKARHYLQNKKLQEQIAALQSEKKRLEERVNMLQHMQSLHSDANEAAPPKQAKAGEEQ